MGFAPGRVEFATGPKFWRPVFVSGSVARAP